MFGFKIIRQYEQGIVFRWGRALPGTRKPGLIWINPVTDRLRKVNMQITVAPVPAQETITRDNVTLRVDAVVYYRVVDPLKALVNVQNYQYAVGQVAQTSLRAVTGQSYMDQLLSDREKINAELREVIDAPTEQPWGVRVERVEVKDVSLAESMKRSMSRQAEAERERRARIIAADGEYQDTRRPRSWPRPARSWRATRPPCSCGCCRPSSRSRPRKTRRLSCPSRWRYCGSSTARPRARSRPRRQPPSGRMERPRCRRCLLRRRRTAKCPPSGRPALPRTRCRTPSKRGRPPSERRQAHLLVRRPAALAARARSPRPPGCGAVGPGR